MRYKFFIIKISIVFALLWFNYANYQCFFHHICHGGHLAHPDSFFDKRYLFDYSWILCSVFSVMASFMYNFRILKWISLVTLFPIIFRLFIIKYPCFYAL